MELRLFHVFMFIIAKVVHHFYRETFHNKINSKFHSINSGNKQHSTRLTIPTLNIIRNDFDVKRWFFFMNDTNCNRDIRISILNVKTPQFELTQIILNLAPNEQLINMIGMPSI